MSRDGVTTVMGNALAGNVNRPVIFAEFNFPSGDVNMWSGLGTISWDGKDWFGVGHLAGVQFPSESSQDVVSGAVFSLDAVDSSWVATGLADNVQGSPCTLWQGERDDAGNILEDPIKFFVGEVDVMPIDVSGNACTINISVERKIFDNRPEGSMYDNETQQRKFAGDKGLEFIPSLAEKTISWGTPTASSGSVNNSPDVGGSSGSGGSSTNNKGSNPRYTNRGGRG